MNQHSMSPGEQARARYRDDAKRNGVVYARIEALPTGARYCPVCGRTSPLSMHCPAHARTAVK